MMEILKELWRDESGATTVEYALIAGFMAAAIVVGIVNTGLYKKIQNLFKAININTGKAQGELQTGHPIPLRLPY